MQSKMGKQAGVRGTFKRRNGQSGRACVALAAALSLIGCADDWDWERWLHHHGHGGGGGHNGKDGGPGEPEACGGLLGGACTEGKFCNYPTEASCGAGDATGLCEEPPQFCPDVDDPVCGCDGETYANACAAAAAQVSVANQGACQEENLIQNGDFELGDTAPAGWTTGGSNPDQADFVWEQSEGLGGSRCVSVEARNQLAVDAHWERAVSVTPGSYYVVAGFVRGENIAASEESFVGPNLSVVDTWAHSTADIESGFSGTFDWREVGLTFRADSTPVRVGARLGYWLATMLGKAFFDDLRMFELAPLATSAHLRLFLEGSDVESSGISQESLRRWLEHLETAYASLQELTGYTPYSGGEIDVVSFRQYPGGWAVAGNPIAWHRPYVAEQLGTVHRDDDWSFGIVHELSHVFDIGAWDFDVEHSANFKLHYAVEMSNGKVWGGSDWAVGGQALEDMWAAAYRDMLARYQETGEPSALEDAITYRFVMIKNAIGWEPFRQTYRAFQVLSPDEVPQTNWERYNRFLDILGQLSATDVRALIPEEEKQAYESKYR